MQKLKLSVTISNRTGTEHMVCLDQSTLKNDSTKIKDFKFEGADRQVFHGLEILNSKIKMMEHDIGCKRVKFVG